MAEIPKTRTRVPNKEAQRLRAFIKQAELMNGWILGARVARREDAAALVGLLNHESIGPKIYTMPSPINEETMAAFIEDHLIQRAARASCSRRSTRRARRPRISTSSCGRNGRSRNSAAR